MGTVQKSFCDNDLPCGANDDVSKLIYSCDSLGGTECPNARCSNTCDRCPTGLCASLSVRDP